MVVSRLPRVPKGKRARFHKTDGVDELFVIIVALTAEVSTLAERLQTLEKVLETSRKISKQAVEKYRLNDQDLARRTVAREALIERVFQALEAQALEASVAQKETVLTEHRNEAYNRDVLLTLTSL
ncbi:MAG: hypothetical protein ACO329_11110 [Steroidobacteraceae bacterium]